MSRNKNNRQAAQYGYNRQSKGYQQNLYKQKLKQENIKAPKNTMTEKNSYRRSSRMGCNFSFTYPQTEMVGTSDQPSDRSCSCRRNVSVPE